ncbi:hypothetical protein LCGC14_0451350 [marine sediment metagenome]|uniref:Uncharacterized protein n=1 Tax=marine sediment metagenome TaxID=412755 RepID=A0A0F9SNB7_9ZZZZ
MPTRVNLIEAEKQSIIQVTFSVVPGTAAYVAGDTLGTIQTVAGVVLANGRKGIVQTVDAADSEQNNPNLDIYLSRASFAQIADNAAFTLSAADKLNTLGHISIVAADWRTWGVASKPNVGKVFSADTLATNMFVQLVIQSGATWTAAQRIDVTMYIIIE